MSNFQRSKKDIKLESHFYSSHYSWKLESKGLDFELFSNKLISNNESIQHIKGLFSYPELKELYLTTLFSPV